MAPEANFEARVVSWVVGAAAVTEASCGRMLGEGGWGALAFGSGDRAMDFLVPTIRIPVAGATKIRRSDAKNDPRNDIEK